MSLIKKIIAKPLFKFTSLNSISILIKIVIGLVTSKILAMAIGPSGMALVGNLRNFLTSIETVSTLGFQNGIVKYVAENEKNDKELNSIFSTLFFCLLISTIIIGCGLFFFSDYLNQLIFGINFHYALIFKILALVLPWYTASIYLLSVINGLGKFKQVLYINIIGTILSLIVTLVLVRLWSIEGALLAIIITPSLLFFITMYYFFQSILVVKNINLQFFDFKIIKNLSHYFLMALVSGVLGSFVFLTIRNHIIDVIGIKEAGYWEAISRISSYYLLFVNTLLMVYYYPKLVIAKNMQETRIVFLDFYKNILPFFGLGLIVVYALKTYIITILFTKDFAPVVHLFLWQLIGDFFKVASLILGLQFFAKKMTKVFIITEIVSLAILYFSCVYCIKYFQIDGVVLAYTFTYIAYFIVLFFYFRKIFFSNQKLNNIS